MQTKVEQYRPRSRSYVSDFEQFLEGFLEQHPQVREDQMRGWYLWWDHRVDLDELDKQRADTVPVKSYQYE